MPRQIAVQTNIRTARRIWKNLSREALPGSGRLQLSTTSQCVPVT